MRHLAGVLAGPWVVGRVRAALLVVVALAAVADLSAYAVLVGGDDAPAAEPPGPEVVARAVLQAVADDDCSGIGDLLAEDAALPYTVTACLDGAPGGAPLDDVRVVDAETDGDASAVTLAVGSAAAGGREAEVVVDLARTGGRWRVTAVAAG